MNIAHVGIEGRRAAPNWAIGQRHLIGAMNRAAHSFVRHATREDGSLKQRSVWTSMDGTDNGYEAFMSFPLFYLVGGDDHIRTTARREWEAITAQYEGYGTVDRGFVTGFDWFHHSESYPYIYYLSMSEPGRADDLDRARAYAAMYIGDDPLAPNWDADRKMLRSPLNGSHGPRLETTLTDWDYHRPILANYLAPFEDLPGGDAGDPHFCVDWTDDELFDQILQRVNERMTHGDVPLNLSSTSLVTHAYLHTGDDRYRQWVLDYLQAWMDRRDANDGIIPDNVGPSGQIGERMDGKWWGGYYGWRWPHGARNITEPAFVAGSCAALMTGDLSWLDLCRSQLDSLWALRREEDGGWKVPARHSDGGWFDFRDPDPWLYIHLAYLSQSTEDRDRLDEVFPDRSHFAGLPPNWGAGKAGICPPKAWHVWNEGGNPGFPDQVQETTLSSMHRALEQIESDESDPEARECYHFQRMNPVVPEGLVQLTMGTPAALYNGGLLQSHLMYYDIERRRPGLPEGMAARVERVDDQSVDVVLVNTDDVHGHLLLLQAGAFGEHSFTGGSAQTDDVTSQVGVNDRHLSVDLGPGAQTRLHLQIRRFAHRPCYDGPDWERITGV
ncbi:MAG: hypothetical protein CME24_10645 [Gemmatimonadetes bacterium]|jgi:hypothetical protein|nr:hypothetical protein [Gemmatimonadota bacterium]